MPARKDDAENTALKQHAFKPGQSGNPNGRPKGARNKFGEEFIDAIRKQFEEHGEAALTKLATTDEKAFIQACVAVLPKVVSVQTEGRDVEELNDDELAALIADARARVAGALKKGSGEDEPSSVH